MIPIAGSLGRTARLARIVVPGRARRVTQRGNRREQIFFEEGDRSLSLGKSKPYAYRKASNVVTVTLPNGIVSTSHYDQLNRLTSLTSQVSSYTYQLSPTGNRTSSSEQNGRTLTWNYNGVNQPTEQTVASDPAGVDGSATYGLDPVGKRLSTSSTLAGIVNGTYAYNPDDEVGSETYDSNGNVLTEGGKTFTYDSENRLTTMNGSAVVIVYDGDGNRVAETIGGVTTRYLVDDLNRTGYSQVIDEVVNGAAVREYALGLQRIDESQPINGTWTPGFYGYDGAGTVRQLTNLSGSVSDTYEYDAFGYLLTSTGTTSNSYLYRGEQYDPNLGLYYLRARYYNPITGRLLSRDAEDGNGDDPKTLHTYIYADGDPANRYDPSGREGAVLDPPVQAPPKAAGGDLAEYGLIVTAISLTAVAALPPVADEVNCVLSNAYTLLFGLAANAGSPVTIRQSSKCVKQVRKKRSCAIDNPQLPVQYVHAIPIPTIALHILLAQQAGRPDKLTYLGPKNPQQELNRKAACPAGKYGGSGTECDEYPYASTVEGGALASTAPVPASQHRRQGGSLGPFYKTISPGQQFCVEVVP